MIRILIWDELQSFHRDERRREQTHERVRAIGSGSDWLKRKKLNKKAFWKNVPSAKLPVKRSPSFRQDSIESCQEKALALPIDALVEESVVAEKADDMPQEELHVSDEGEESQREPKALTGEAVTTPKAVTGYASVQTYQNLFGPMQGDFAHRLITLENMWGSEPTCTAIEMAHENKVNNINYIAAILKNSNGRPMRGKRKEDEFHGYPNFNEYVEGVLRGEPEYKPHLHRNAEGKSGLRHIGDPGEILG